MLQMLQMSSTTARTFEISVQFCSSHKGESNLALPPLPSPICRTTSSSSVLFQSRINMADVDKHNIWWVSWNCQPSLGCCYASNWWVVHYSSVWFQTSSIRTWAEWKAISISCLSVWFNADTRFVNVYEPLLCLIARIRQSSFYSGCSTLFCDCC